MFVSKFLIFYIFIYLNGKYTNATYRPEKHTLAKYVVFLNYRHIKYMGDHQFCGGSILSKTKILTAGHCLVNGNKMKARRELIVVAGSPYRLYGKVKNAQVLKIRKMIVHEDFEYKTAKSDIGLIILRHGLKENAQTQSIALPKAPPVIGAECSVLGWGRIYSNGPSPDEVLYSRLYILHNINCQNESFSVGMLCAGDPLHNLNVACEGDSGGPLIFNETVIGIVSFGPGCGMQFYAGVFTDVWYYKNWIEANSSVHGKFKSRLIFFLICILLKLKCN